MITKRKFCFRSNFNSLENVWFDYRLSISNASIELIEKKDENQEEQDFDNESCARCRIYRRKFIHEKPLSKKLHRLQQNRRKINHSTVSFSTGLFFFHLQIRMYSFFFRNSFSRNKSYHVDIKIG